MLTHIAYRQEEKKQFSSLAEAINYCIEHSSFKLVTINVDKLP